VTESGRPVAEVTRPPRLPVWPVAGGVASFASELVGLRGLARGLERRFGGRVQPMSLPTGTGDPFLMLVHHRHTFSAWDPLRPLSALVMPEGFPAHPHRGFETVTFVLEGALRHRDSAGVKMVYRGESAQWLTAGRGVLHEEMWDPSAPVHELYQLWVNLPRAHKLDPPRIQLLGAGEVDGTSGAVARVPLAVAEADGTRLTVLAGSCGGVTSAVSTHSPLAVVRLSWARAGTGFRWDGVPAWHTAWCFVRSGAVEVGGRRVDAHHLARFAREPGGPGGLRFTSLEPDTDALVFTGAPLGEPVALGGSMVMNTEAEVARAHADFQAGRFGVPWPPSASDEEWRRGLRTP
jgi:redox-sensitive bicupin YhaK (pirin superfamily)